MRIGLEVSLGVTRELACAEMGCDVCVGKVSCFF